MSAQILGIIKMDEVHNIVAEQNGWGQLENGSWINLEFTVPHEPKETTEIPENFVTDISIVSEEKPEVSSIITTSISEVAKDSIILHKVKKKESLWDIAEHYYGIGNGNRYVEIEEFNKLKSDILHAGMVLKIPNV